MLPKRNIKCIKFGNFYFIDCIWDEKVGWHYNKYYYIGESEIMCAHKNLKIKNKIIFKDGVINKEGIEYTMLDLFSNL